MSLTCHGHIPVLVAYAKFIPLHAKPNTYPFIYARAGGGETLLVIFNPAAAAVTVGFNFPTACRKLTLLAGKGMKVSNEKKTLTGVSKVTNHFCFYKCKSK